MSDCRLQARNVAIIDRRNYQSAVLDPEQIITYGPREYRI